MSTQKSCIICKGIFFVWKTSTLSPFSTDHFHYFSGEDTATCTSIETPWFFLLITVPVAQLSPGFSESLQHKWESQRYLIPFPIIFPFFPKACAAKPHCYPWQKKILFFLTILAVIQAGTRTSFSMKALSIMEYQSNRLYNSSVVIHSLTFSTGSKWCVIPHLIQAHQGERLPVGKMKRTAAAYSD